MGNVKQFFCSLGVALGLALPLGAEPVTIFAASSLKTALDKVIEEHALDVVAVYGGSAAMARQISQGGAADIVILAHGNWMDWLEENGALLEESRCDFLGNRLVLAAPVGALDLDIRDAAGILVALDGGRLAVGQLRAVPVGQYTAEYLTKRGWLETLRPHLAQTANVRLALALIARGEAPLGFVYASDVRAEKRVRAVFVPDPAEYSAIRYPFALTKTANVEAQNVAAALFAATQVYQENGFTLLPKDDEERCK